MAVSCCKISKKFPREAMFGLVSQLRRSSASVAANIAEGHGRESSPSYVQFLRIAQGLLKETETRLILAVRLELGAAEELNMALVAFDDIGKMLRSPMRIIQHRK